MTAGLSALFWGIVTLSLLVVVHEGGHFLAARAFGVRVREFMIGLPGPKLSVRRGNTLYGVTALPLGGYVKVVGMEGDQHNPLLNPVLAYITAKQSVTIDDLCAHFNVDESVMYPLVVALRDLEAVRMERRGPITACYPPTHAEDPDALLGQARANSYLTLPASKRVAILLAGVALNLATALVVFTIVLAGWGMYQDAGYVNPVPGAPATLAGIPDGAHITSLDSVPVSDFSELTREIQKHQVGDSVTVDFVFGDAAESVQVVLARSPEGTSPFLGVSPHYVQVPLSIGEAIATSFDYLWLTAKAIAGFFNPARFTETIEQSASVVGIAVIAAEAVKAGPYEYAGLIAAISLSLGLMNLLPIPPLDGGKIVIELVEKLRRKPLSMRASLAISALGFSLLFTLMAYLIYHDIGRFIAR